PTSTKRPVGLTDLVPKQPQPVVKLVLADDHSVLRKALVSSLDTRPEFAVVGEAANGDEALEQTLELSPDVLVLDLNMPGKGGLDILPVIRQQASLVKVLVLTGREESGYIV